MKSRKPSQLEIVAIMARASVFAFYLLPFALNIRPLCDAGRMERTDREGALALLQE